MTRRVLALIVVVLVVLAGAGCGPKTTKNPEVETTIKGAQLGGSTPGSVLTAVTIPGLDPAVAESGVRAAKITYRSTDPRTGELTVVSGTVFAPDADPPPGGWNVIALGHGSTGIDKDCAPSGDPELGGQIPLIINSVKSGLVVTMADYQGLGAQGVHRYGDSWTAGLNVIDSVRAARRVFSGASKNWAAIGGSQGGGAVWAADEQAAVYAPELNLVGAIALAPVTDVSPVVDLAVAGTMTAAQRPIFQWILASLGDLHPDLDLDLYRRGFAAENWALLSSCSALRTSALTLGIGAEDLAPQTPAAAALLKTFLKDYALPTRKLSAPLLVAYGGQDAYIDPQWTRDGIAKACALGGVITDLYNPEGTHQNPGFGAIVPWLIDRFTGKPLESDCPGA